MMKFMAGYTWNEGKAYMAPGTIRCSWMWTAGPTSCIIYVRSVSIRMRVCRGFRHFPGGHGIHRETGPDRVEDIRDRQQYIQEVRL